MKMNRIQFQSGMSLTQFLNQYGTQEQCEATLEASRWGHPLYAVISTVKSFCKEEVELWARRSLVPSSLVVFDGLWCFQTVEAAE